MPELLLRGNDVDNETFTQVHRHYIMAEQDLRSRIPEFDKVDTLFRSHIPPANWPYRSMVFDPRVITALFEKTSRILANKPRGRVVPREGGDVLKAKIINEVLSFQWDDNERCDAMPMLAKWAQMDLNARKYGASFGLAKWHWQKCLYKDDKGKSKSKVFYDGPNFIPLNNRDCLANPSYSQIKNWFQHRDYVTLNELKEINDSAQTEPVYKNLDILRQALKDESKTGSDSRSTNYVIKNKSIKGLTDYLGQDEMYKVVEIVTEYRPERWVTFAPRHGVVLRDIPNPYDHGQIPVVMLKYYSIDDDLYGISEIEPIMKLQNGVNALLNQYLDGINMSLYPIVKMRGNGAVKMNTIEFGPAKKWIMNDPQTDVVPHTQDIIGVREFPLTYRLLVGAMQEALGETSAGQSGADPGNSNKTATEIKDLSFSRSARDNFNQLFLGEAMKKQMQMWHLMDQQFMFSNPAEKYKMIRIVGKDAMNYFKGAGLDTNAVSDQSMEMMSDPDVADSSISVQDLQEPMYPVETPEGIVNKFSMDDTGQVGKLYLEPDDLSGTYDYIPDVGSMNSAANEEEVKAKTIAIEQITKGGLGQMINADGNKVKISDMAIDLWEDMGWKNADQYIEKLPVQPMIGGQNGINPTGAGVPQAGQPPMVNGQLGGIPQGIPSVSGGQASGVVPGPGQVYA